MQQLKRSLVSLGLAMAGFLGLLALASPASALPSFAAQTGSPCSSCHVGGYGPQLTPFGRKFKIDGYGATSSWSVNKGYVPLAGMAIGTFTRTGADQSGPAADGFNANDNAALQELAGFIAGRVAPGVGAFAQATYSGIDKTVSMDNLDIRYAREMKVSDVDTVVGVSLNNNPTIQDPFNSTPGWGYPYVSSELVPESVASPLIAGGLSQQVMGLVPYAAIGDHWYVELGGYRSLSASALDKVNVDPGDSLKGTAPYWRLAYTTTLGGQTFAFGGFGMTASILPGRSPGDADRYSDLGLDASYQYSPSSRWTYTVQGALIDERRKLVASFGAGDAAEEKGKVRSISLDGSAYWKKTYGLTLGLFDTSGSRDAILYSPAPDTGSRAGRPDTSGYRLQADWTPLGQESSWGAPLANLRLGLQYTGYSKFNGAKKDYDGSGRAARDNNTLALFLWTAF